MSIRPTFYGLEIGKTGLYVSQKGLDVTGHNVANVDTAGYTRQRLINTSYAPYSGVSRFRPSDNALVGGGALTMILDQTRSLFLDRQYRTEQTLLSKWATRTQGLNYIEALYEGTDGEATVTGVVNGLFDGFNAMLKEGNDAQQRTYLKGQADKLCEQFKHIYDQLVAQQKDQNLAAETVVNQINTLSQSMTVLNKKIAAFELNGQPANDLRDKRNLILDQLSSLIDIEYEGDAIGGVFEVRTGGKVLVHHNTANLLTVRKIDNPLGAGYDEVSEVCWDDDTPGVTPADLEAFDLTKLTGGELLGHLELRDSMDAARPGVPYFVTLMNTLAQSIVSSVNAVHRTGYTHPSSGAASTQGVNFFHSEPMTRAAGEPILDANGDPVLDGGGNPTYYVGGEPALDAAGNQMYDVSGITAGNLRLSSEVMASVFNIAASSLEINLDGTALEAGNQEIARKLFALTSQQDVMLQVPNPDYNPADPASERFVTKGIGSFEGFISSIVLDIAVTLEHSKEMQDTQNILALSADNQRTSIAGVSLDEEMTNLIKYNHAYGGASRVITTMDEALDVLINKMGRVGL